jgi:hypothetical protein
MRIRPIRALVASLMLSLFLVPSGVGATTDVYGGALALYNGDSHVVAGDGTAVDTYLTLVATRQLGMAGARPRDEAWFYLQKLTWSADGTLVGYEIVAADPASIAPMHTDPNLRLTTASGSLPCMRWRWDFANEQWIITPDTTSFDMQWTGTGPLGRFHVADVLLPGDVGQITASEGVIRESAPASGSADGVSVPLANTSASYVYLARYVNVIPASR